MREIEKIALASLLHDIGKFYQRARNERIPKDKYEKSFIREHAYYTYLWIKEKKDILNSCFEGLDTEELAKLASSHHKNFKDLNNIEKIIQNADWFSSAERERILEDEANILHCVFERVSFTEEIKESNDLKYFAYYRLKPLSLDDTIFPVVEEGVFEGQSVKLTNIEKLNKNLQDSYRQLYKEFEEDFYKIKNFKDSQALNFIYYLLQKYTWCVPASIYDQDKKSRHYPDISLFDHSRVLAMIATSLYDYWEKTGDNLNFEELKHKNFLLMVEGDIGGIQKFIYNIGKTQGIEGFSVSKALRGRSFIVSMIPEIISRYILRELGYPITNILYVGGGKFQLIVANTKENNQKLDILEEKLNKYMFDQFFGEISLTLVKKEFSGNYLLENGKSFFDLIDEVQILLDEKKKKKFGKLLAESSFKDKDSVCKSCKTVPANEGEEVCSLCKISHVVGDKLPKIKFLIFESQPQKGTNIEILNMGEFGAVYGCDEITQNLDAQEILAINDTKFDKNNGFKFIGNTIPIIKEDDIPYLKELLSGQENSQEEIKEKTVLPFKLLAKLSDGDEKLGVFRADVDNLGLIFSEGLRRKNPQDTNRYTISRIATLSRMLDLFFSGYINSLAKKVSQQEKLKIKDKDGNPVSLKMESLIYTVYSGGDDIFIIAPYNVAIKFALELRKDFYEYTARNLDFGLSGGILVSTSTMPIKLMAEFAEKLESRSKKVCYIADKNLYTKDSISIFNKTYRWKRFNGVKSFDEFVKNEFIGENLTDEECKKEYSLKDIGISEKNDLIYFEEIIQIVEDITNRSEAISRGFFYKLLELYRSYIPEKDNDKQQSKKIYAGIFPKIYYQIARNFKQGDVRNFLEELLLTKGYVKDGVVVISRDDVLKNLDTIISLVLMKTRGGD